MGQIRLKNSGHGINLIGQAPFMFEKELSPELALAVFNDSDPRSSTCIGRWYRDVEDTERDRMFRFCHRIGGEVWDTFRRAAVTWASVANPSGSWDMTAFSVCYSTEVDRSWITKLIVTTCGARFVHTARGVMSFKEFELAFGRRVDEALVEIRDRNSARLDDIIRNATAPVIKKELVLLNSSGAIVRQTVHILETLRPEEWVMPSGYTYVSADE